MDDGIWAIPDSNPQPLPCEDSFALGEGFIGWVIKVAHRSLKAPGSPSSAWATTYFLADGAARAARHF